MSDFQAGAIALVLIALALLAGWYLHLIKVPTRRAGHSPPLDFPMPICCRANAPRLYALRQVFESMPTDAETSDQQVEEMTLAVDELMQIWRAKPTLTIVQASQSVMAIRWAAQTNFARRSK